MCEENAVGFGLWLAYYWPFWFRGRSHFSISRLKASFRNEQAWRRKNLGEDRNDRIASQSDAIVRGFSSVIDSVMIRSVDYHDHGSQGFCGERWRFLAPSIRDRVSDVAKGLVTRPFDISDRFL